MKSIISLAVALSLLLTSLPASAQWPQPSVRQLSNWSSVRTISAGAPINAAYVGRRQEFQYFVSAGDETLTVLTPEHLPRAARRTLIEIARTQPDFFTTTTWIEITHGKVRVNPDGIWVKGHRIAAVRDFVTTIERGDVAEVSQRIRVRRRHQFGEPPSPGEVAILGAGAVVAGPLLMKCGERCGPVVGWGLLLGVPAALGILSARRDDNQWTTVTIYRAP